MIAASPLSSPRGVRRAALAGAPRASAPIRVALATLCGLSACQPKVSIGAWTCSEDGAASVVPDASAPVAVPWSTGFENGFCDYTELGGYCYPQGVPQLVTSPTPHSGHYAAAFSVNSADSALVQTRCVRRGALPLAAVYGAWYYIPSPETNTGNWNLFHFTGGKDTSSLAGFLDVSLVTVNGELQAVVRGPNFVPLGNPANPPPVPIGKWFRLELYLKRAPGTDGEVALYQDTEDQGAQQLFDVTGVATDDSDVGEWYVGNLAALNALSPADSTVYVDDVTISAAP